MQIALLSQQELIKEAYPQTAVERITKAKSLLCKLAQDDEEIALVYHLLEWKEHEARCQEQGRDPGTWMDVDYKHHVPTKLVRYYRTRCSRAARITM